MECQREGPSQEVRPKGWVKGVGEKRTCTRMCDEDPVPPSFGAAPSV